MVHYVKQKRDLKDSAQDTILFLYFLNKIKGKIAEKTLFDAQLKLMKLIFLIELKMVNDKEKGFNFLCYNHHKGPYSNDLFALVDDIKEAKLMGFDHAKNSFFLTKRGEKIINDFIKDQTIQIKNNNKNFFKNINDIVTKYGNLSAGELKEKVYQMEIKTPSMTKKMKIGETAGEGKPKTRILMRLSNYKKEFFVSPEWIDTIKFFCTPELEDIISSCYEEV